MRVELSWGELLLVLVGAMWFGGLLGYQLGQGDMALTTIHLGQRLDQLSDSAAQVWQAQDSLAAQCRVAFPIRPRGTP